MLIALATRAALAAQARSWLHYTFAGVPARPQTAVGIFANNTRELMAVFGLLLIAQLAVRRDGRPTRAQLLLRTGGELILSGAIVANMLVVGAAIGGYGTRMVRAMLPHGPVEVAAYALALALYVQGRSRPLPIHAAGGHDRGQRRAAGRRRPARDVRVRPMRMLLVGLLIAGGIGASVLLISREAGSLHGLTLFSSSSTTSSPGPPAQHHAKRAHEHHRAGSPPASKHSASGVTASAAQSTGGDDANIVGVLHVGRRAAAARRA